MFYFSNFIYVCIRRKVIHLTYAFLLIIEALKIALEAKRKKQAILEKTEEMKPKKKKETLGPLQSASSTKYKYIKDQNQSKFE